MSAELVAKYPKVDPFLLKKWERLFNAFFDRNAGGDVDWADFYLVVRQVRDIYGAQSEQMKYAKSSMKALWEGLLGVADENKDGIISLEEWVDVISKSNESKEPKWFIDYVTYMFKLFDVSEDGKLDLAEYTDGMLAYGFDTEEAHAGFAKFAVDKSGKSIPAIDFMRFHELWKQYFYSTLKKSPGNCLFGLFPEDKVLDRAEYVDGLHAYGWDDADSCKAFGIWAKTPAGKAVPSVDLQRWKELVHQYFFSKDAAAPGNHIFGLCQFAKH